MPLHYDVLIIGAGPAGCTAARSLTQAGFKVILAEKEEAPGANAYGGFLPREAGRLIEDNFSSIPAAVLSRDPEGLGACLIFEDGSRYDLPFPQSGLSVSRARLDAFMMKECGADTIAPCTIVDLRMERFQVQADLDVGDRRETVEATYLIGADGGDSTILRYLRPEFYRTFAAPNLLTVSVVSGAGAADLEPGWMGLLVKKGTRAMHRLFRDEGLIALAINHPRQGDWHEELRRVLALLKERVGLEMDEQTIAMTCVTNTMGAAGRFSLGAGSALLAGEAAGLLDPWGSGIHLALKSGLIAAESLIESAGQSVTPHLHYRYRMQDLLSQEIGQRRRLGGIIGDLDTSSLIEDTSRAGRRNRRELRRHFF